MVYQTFLINDPIFSQINSELFDRIVLIAVNTVVLYALQTAA